MGIFIISLFLFWIILNGSLTIEVILFGIGISIFVSIFTYKRTRLTYALEKKVFRKSFLIIDYLITLTIEVFKANFDMIRLVLSPKPEIKPTLMNVKTDLKSRISRVALANSITLTPGTITVAMDKDELLIHGIHSSNLEGIDESIFVQKLRRLEE